MQRCTQNMPLCFVLRTFSTRSALVILHNYTSVERVLNVGTIPTDLQLPRLHGAAD